MKQKLKIFATSKWFDLLGVALVISIAIASGYLATRLDKFVGLHLFHLDLFLLLMLVFQCYRQDLQEN